MFLCFYVFFTWLFFPKTLLHSSVSPPPLGSMYDIMLCWSTIQTKPCSTARRETYKIGIKDRGNKVTGITCTGIYRMLPCQCVSSGQERTFEVSWLSWLTVHWFFWAVVSKYIFSNSFQLELNVEDTLRSPQPQMLLVTQHTRPDFELDWRKKHSDVHSVDIRSSRINYSPLYIHVCYAIVFARFMPSQMSEQNMRLSHLNWFISLT